MQISGNTILLTGGTSGIGMELARQLLARGNTVIITGRDEARLEGAKAVLPGVHTFRSDVSNPADIEALHRHVTAEFPALNMLINNAGIMRRLNLTEISDDITDVTREVVTNLQGPIQMVQQFLPHLKAQPRAAILNVSSGVAFLPLPISPIYCAAKSGLHFYTMSLRAQLKYTDVKVFELCPPATSTPLLDHFPADDMGGVPLMPVEKMVAVAVRGLERDQYEIRPGSANLLKLMSRIAPGFMFGMLSKSVDTMVKPAR